MATVKYTTLPNDRWDLIAHKAYGTLGDVTIDGVVKNAIVAIMENNPNVPYSDVLPGNIDLFIPIVKAPEQNILLLPPWKRKLS